MTRKKPNSIYNFSLISVNYYYSIYCLYFTFRTSSAAWNLSVSSVFSCSYLVCSSARHNKSNVLSASSHDKIHHANSEHSMESHFNHSLHLSRSTDTCVNKDLVKVQAEPLYLSKSTGFEIYLSAEVKNNFQPKWYTFTCDESK